MRFSYSQNKKVLLYIRFPIVYNAIINAETEVVKMDFITLNNGTKAPQVGIGTFLMQPKDAQEAWNRAFEGFVGSDVHPFAVLGTKVTKGLNYIFAAEMFPVGHPLEKRVTLVVVNDMAECPLFVDILPARGSGALGYAFTWL